MRKVHVIIVNGQPMVGKDTVIGLMRRKAIDLLYEFSSYSTIDPIKEALKMLGWDGNKDDVTREILANIKQWWVNDSNGPLKFCVEKIIGRCQDENHDNIIVFQIREPTEITKLVEVINTLKLVYDIECHTLLITRSGVSDIQYSNAADTYTNNYNYDNKIANDGDREELYEKIKTYLKYILTKSRKESEDK